MNYRQFSCGVKVFLALVMLAILGMQQKAQATHLRAGEIIVERIDCQRLEFRITIVVYTDTGSDVRFGEGLLDFGDGSEPVQLPQIENTDRSDLGDEVATASFTINHTYSSVGTYKIGYVEPNRNEGVLNIDNSVNTTFYVETQIEIDNFFGCNNSPVLLIPPIDRACPGVAYFHNPGAYDPDGDSLSYELVVPKKEIGVEVDGYLPINNNSFYDNPSQGNEDLNGPPVFNIDPITGELTWDAPGTVGEYNIAFIVKEYRKIGDTYYQMGFVTRDMQIIVEDCDNERPELEVPEDICVEAGTIIDETIYGTDPDNDDVKIEAFSQVFQFGATVVPNDGSYQPSVPPAELQFTWATECTDVREQPYKVDFKITDNPSEGPRLVDLEPWLITVIGPKPELDTVVQEGQGLRISWDSYTCQNAENIEVWRRVDSNPYVPEECETGIRENAGYSLVNTLDVAATSFKDENLAAAAKYCYRLVATFPSPAGGESIVSDEVCFEFVPAKEPVITHVSVEETDETEGEIIVAWHAPLDSGTLTPPFTYRIHRAEGFTGVNNLTLVDEITVPDLDPNIDSIGLVDTGLNTLDKIYNYRITLVDPDSDDDLVSAVASNVRLEPTPQFGSIKLDWSAVVPWSNTIAAPPNSQHLIYRGLEGEELEFLTAVDVTQRGFSYTDSDNLSDDKVYCYRILTKGTYGNPEIQGAGLDPLLNFSQIICAQPSDSIPPCEPVVRLEGPSCEDLTSLSCNFNDFQNDITWTTDFVGQCQDDVRVYEVWYAPTTDSEFTKIAETREESFLHEDISSFKGCYKIKAIDRSGNESEFSNTICRDNCPNFELPNVFTPGNNDGCNDLFSAYSDNRIVGEDGSSDDCGSTVTSANCTRFVLAVDFAVYNRWGKEVYAYSATAGSEPQVGNLPPELINWDGRDNNGYELPAGVYYYLAKVTFDVVDPTQAQKDIKGWVHLIR